MRKVISIRRLALVILIVSGCLLIIGTGSRGASTEGSQVTSQEPWTKETVLPASIISSRLKLAPVNAVILADTTVDVTLRNDYDKRIVAVRAWVNETFYTRHYLGPGPQDSQKLASGDNDQFSYPKPLNSGERIRILAVTFIDGTGDGDESQVKHLLDERRGRKTQLLRMLPYFQLLGSELQSLRKGSYKRVRSRFATLKSVAQSLAIKTDDGTPLTEGFELGLRGARAIVLREYVSKLEEELIVEHVQEWYDQFGQKLTSRSSPDANFRARFNRINREFMAFLHRL